MLAPAADPATPRPRRRSLQFSLATLLLAVALCALWFGTQAGRARAQKRAVTVLRQMGGWVLYDYQYPSGNRQPDAEPWAPAWLRRLVGDDYFQTVVEVQLANSARITPEGLALLTDLPEIKHLYAFDAPIDDAAMAHVGKLTRLESFGIDHTRITATALRHLRRLTQLRWLDLSDTNIDDPSLVHLRGLVNLEDLRMSNCKISDAGLAYLQSLQNLRHLCLDSNRRITDAGLVHLEGLTNLRYLDLVDTGVTGQGEKRLLSALPNLEIIR